MRRSIVCPDLYASAVRPLQLNAPMLRAVADERTLCRRVVPRALRLRKVKRVMHACPQCEVDKDWFAGERAGA